MAELQVTQALLIEEQLLQKFVPLRKAPETQVKWAEAEQVRTRGSGELQGRHIFVNDR